MVLNKEKIFRLSQYLSITALLFLWLPIAQKKQLWYDELDWTVSFITQSLPDMLTALMCHIYNLPLYYLIAKPFYMIYPTSEIWLLLPSIFFMIMGSIYTSKIGRLLEDFRLEVLAFYIALTSTILFSQGGLEFRPYSLLFFCSAYTLWWYVKRLQKPTTKNILGYGLAMTALLYTHWFGGLLIGFYALCDFSLWVRKKVAFKCCLSYILTLALFLPYLIGILYLCKLDVSQYWGKVRSFSLQTEVLYLLSKSFILYAFFLIGAFFSLKNRGIWSIIFLSIIWGILSTWFYSYHLNPNGGMFISRYFLVTLPHTLLISSYGAFIIIKRFPKEATYILLFVLLLSDSHYRFEELIRAPFRYDEKYKSTAQYFSSPLYLHQENSVIMSRSHTWINHYFSQYDIPKPQNIVFFKSFGWEKNPLSYIHKNGFSSNKEALSLEELKKFEYIYKIGKIGTQYDDLEETKNFIEKNYDKIETVDEIELTILKKKTR